MDINLTDHFQICGNCEKHIMPGENCQYYDNDYSVRCEKCQNRRDTANKARRDRHELLTSLGLVRVKGSLGGTYYE